MNATAAVYADVNDTLSDVAVPFNNVSSTDIRVCSSTKNVWLARCRSVFTTVPKLSVSCVGDGSTASAATSDQLRPGVSCSGVGGDGMCTQRASMPSPTTSSTRSPLKQGGMTSWSSKSTGCPGGA